MKILTPHRHACPSCSADVSGIYRHCHECGSSFEEPFAWQHWDDEETCPKCAAATGCARDGSGLFHVFCRSGPCALRGPFTSTLAEAYKGWAAQKVELLNHVPKAVFLEYLEEIK